MYMIIAARRAAALAILLLLSVGAPAFAQSSKPIAHPLPTPHYSKEPLHTEFVVEVNRLGQVVRVKSGKSCKDLTFNAQTYGNVLQMWIRRPDGTAEVGLYRVTFDYEPAHKKVRRDISLIRSGGDWGDKRGAANDMMDMAQKQQEKMQSQGKSSNLPSLQQITSPSPKPSPRA